MKHLLKYLVFVLTLLISILIPVGTVEAKIAPVKSCPQYEQLIRRFGLPVAAFSKIMWRESRCQPKAIGWNYYPNKNQSDCKPSHVKAFRQCRAVRSYDIGLLQVNSSWRTVTFQICKTKDVLALQKPLCNIKVASYLYQNGGMGHWAGNSVAQ